MSDLIYKLVKRALLLVQSAWKALEKLAHWAGRATYDEDYRRLPDTDDIHSGSYNRVIVAGNYAVRMCLSKQEDPSWGYLRYCHKNPGTAHAVRVFAMGRINGYMWAITEALPVES